VSGSTTRCATFEGAEVLGAVAGGVTAMAVAIDNTPEPNIEQADTAKLGEELEAYVGRREDVAVELFVNHGRPIRTCFGSGRSGETSMMLEPSWRELMKF
jgi:hypothetical protein